MSQADDDLEQFLSRLTADDAFAALSASREVRRAVGRYLADALERGDLSPTDARRLGGISRFYPPRGGR